MNNVSIKYNFGLGLFNTMLRRSEEERLSAAILPCKSGDGASTIIKEMLKGLKNSKLKIAVLDFNSDNSEYGDLGCKPQDLSVLLEAQTTASINSSNGNIYWARPENETAFMNAKYGVKEIKNLLSRFKENFNLVLIDGPAMLQGNLCEIIALSVDQVYIVIRQESTTHFQAMHSVDKLNRLGIETSGIILNDRRLPIPKFIYRLLFRRKI